MRIIDKNHDFYDYLQSHDDTIVFDRRNSFMLTREIFCESLMPKYHRHSKYRYVLMQTGAHYWLILVSILRFQDIENWVPVDYDLTLLSEWEDYSKPLKCLELNVIDIKYTKGLWDYKERDYTYGRILGNVQYIVDAVRAGSYTISKCVSEYKVCRFNKSEKVEEVKTIPILSACGVQSFVDPQVLFCAIEEYFSTQKTLAETTEPKGASNEDKITMHGFDTKTSFRGKR